jgi:phosphoglycerol transferase MdoB-like AlkP superfamily enzyme
MILKQYKAGYLRGCVRLLLIFCVLSLMTRLGLIVLSWNQIQDSPFTLLLSFFVGIPFDIAAAFALTSIWVGILLFLSPFYFQTSSGRKFLGILLMIFTFSLIFLMGSEFVFWGEFQARLNFIAIDYLTYTHEVVKNIWESYPMGWILSGILIFSGLLLLPFWKSFREDFCRVSYFSERSAVALTWFLVTAVLTWILDNRMTHRFHNPYFQEIARNGLYSFAAGWWDQRIEYDEFYITKSREERSSYLKRELLSSNSHFLTNDASDLWRRVDNPPGEKRWNVIQITVESLSASYMGVFGNPEQLTPHLDRMSQEGLLFTQLYATGSRTIRGMESLVLSLPPTPGQSVIRRKDNHGLFSLGYLFQTRGYVTNFFYGGRGFFDNMNDFFSGNGFQTFDQTSTDPSWITFKNAWGACDGDVYNWVLHRCDEITLQGQPFYHFIMTTSNHRPYTFPEGLIDLPPRTDRAAVKYTDFAIGEFIQKAKLRPWFKNTIFVIVADHCAKSSGKTSIPLQEYHIPLIIWQPDIIAPQKIERNCSQMDVPPTIAGILNWSYDSLFFGKDILKMRPDEERSFSATYQKLGYYRDEQMTILEPVKKHQQYRVSRPGFQYDKMSEQTPHLDESISYYQTSSEWISQGLYRPMNAPSKTGVALQPGIAPLQELKTITTKP